MDLQARGESVYKLIIFDLGGVLINYSEAKYYAYLSTKNISMERIKKTIEPLIPPVELGLITQDALEVRISKSLGIPKNSLNWSKAFEQLASTNDCVKKLVQKLHKDHRVVLLSNISKSRYEVASTKYFSPSLFDEVFVSYALHMRKPSARIFRYVLKHMHTKASEALFIDNQRENVAGARKIGIRSILFTDCTALKKKLKQANVI